MLLIGIDMLHELCLFLPEIRENQGEIREGPQSG